VVPLYALPHHLLSRLVLHLTRWRLRPWKNLLISVFRRCYDVDMSTAACSDLREFENFNRFFTRELKPGARTAPDTPAAVACPVDGSVSRIGGIDGDAMLQAKGHHFQLEALLGGDRDHASCYHGGRFATLYLSPRDYHRVHMPVDGRLLSMTYVPGRLFPVNRRSTRTVTGLFARNERIICRFATAAGDMALILVGALFVGSMETVWSGQVTPAPNRRISIRDHSTDGIGLNRGQEMGRFNMGSTVLLLFGADRVTWVRDIEAGSPVRMGQAIGTVLVTGGATSNRNRPGEQ